MTATLADREEAAPRRVSNSVAADQLRSIVHTRNL